MKEKILTCKYCRKPLEKYDCSLLLSQEREIFNLHK